MADSIFELITKNIYTTLNGASITYNGSAKTITCERERFSNVIADRSPLLLISGPIVEVAARAHLRCHCTLHYLLTLVDNSINDEYNPDATVLSISEVMGNSPSDLIKLVMVDRTRGGNANNTEFNGVGYYFDNDGDTTFFNAYIQLEIKAFVRDTDPYFTGG